MATTTKKTRAAKAKVEAPWTVADAANLYKVSAWGDGYFAVGPDGHVIVQPDATPDRAIDLVEVVEGLRARGLVPPLVIRFSDILKHRLRRIQRAFTAAIEENGYRGDYVPVYPIKVNQQRSVVQEVYRYGKEVNCGLEAGSKPELLAVLAITEASPDRLIVCNGFKDRKYIEATVLAGTLGRRIVTVIESLSDAALVSETAAAFGARPALGIRVRLASGGAGRWESSVGDGSKFGLDFGELLEAHRLLSERGLADCIEMVHCHAGSQIQEIGGLRDAVDELSHVAVELARLGATIRYIDVGGGLAVDYTGTQSNDPSSMNYTLEEYASNVVYRIANVCNSKGVPHPTIVTESGRAITAHHCVLVFECLRAAGPRRSHIDREEVTKAAVSSPPIRDLLEAHDAVARTKLVECYHDAVRARSQAQELFNLGYLDLRAQALAEQLFWATCTRLWDLASRLPAPPEDLARLEVHLRDTYFCNFSVFQSLPDHWAVDQLFPVMPLHRLDERPTRKAVLVDITCDSDGKIDRFVGPGGGDELLDLHELRPGEPYCLGAFLIGAYQETLGDLHNLFGDTHVVHIRMEDHGGWWIDEVVRGDSAREVLGYVQYDVKELYPSVSRDCERAVRDGRMTLAQSQALLRFYESALDGYTYLT